MKKGLTFAAISAVTISAVAVPVASVDAAANTASKGFYDTVENKFYTVAEFQNLTSAEKVNLITKDGFYLHTGTHVISGKDAALSTNDELVSKLVEKEQFTAADLNAIYEEAQNPNQNTDLTIESVSAINDTKIKVTFSDGSEAEFDLDETLVEGENELTFSHNDVEYNYTFTYTLPVAIAAVEPFEDIYITEGEEPELPTVASVIYEDETEGELDVVWDLDEVDFSKVQTHKLTGVVGEDTEVTVDVIVTAKNTIATLVAAVKSTADNGTAQQFEDALTTPELRLENITEENLPAYKQAIKDAFVVNSVETIQEIIYTVNEEIATGTEELVAAVISEIKAASTTTALKAILTANDDHEKVTDFVAPFYGVIDNETVYLAAYKTALDAAELTTFADVQEAINAGNTAVVVKAIEKAENSKVKADADLARAELDKVVNKYDGDAKNNAEEKYVFDKAEEGTDAGALETRVAAIEKLSGDLKALADAITGVVTEAKTYYGDGETGDPTAPLVEALSTLKGLDDTLTYTDANEAAYAEAIALAYKDVTDYKDVTVKNLQSLITAGDKAVLADAIAEVFTQTNKAVIPVEDDPATDVEDETEAAGVINDGERTAVTAALAALKAIDSTLTYKTEDANVDQYIKDLNATFNTDAKKKAATVKSIQNAITAADAKVEAGVQEGLVADVFTTAKALVAGNDSGEKAAFIAALEELDSVKPLIKKGEENADNVETYATKLDAFTEANKDKATEETIKSTIATVNAEETAKLVKTLVETAKETGDNEAAVKLAITALINDVEELDGSSDDSFKGTVKAYSYKAAIAKLATTATVAEVDAVVVEVNTVGDFNAELNKAAADIRTAMTKLAAIFELPTYDNLTYAAKLDVANLVKENAPKQLDAQGEPTSTLEFKSTDDIVAAIEAQSAAQPALVESVNNASTRAELSSALKAINAFAEVADVDIQEQIIDKFWSNKNAETGTKFPYDSIAAILEAVTEYTPA